MIDGGKPFSVAVWMTARRLPHRPALRHTGEPDITAKEHIMKIAVAGATGRLGRHVAEVLTERGHQVVVMSRATGVDIITGSGLEAALDGAEVIIDAATSPSPEQRAATEFFVTAAHNLVELARMLAARRGTPVTVQGVRDPADPDAEIQAAGGLLPGPGARLAGPTFAQWLDQQ
jgi:uncharacterized protein YbjT (DUF2867 family)